MLEGLKGNLRTAIKKIVNSSGVDEKLIKALAHDVQLALLNADVDVPLVFEISKQLKERSLKENPPPGLSRKDHIVKILYDELAKLLGTEAKFEFVPGRINKVLMLGIQGSGKTTVTAKMSLFLTKQGYRVGVIGADTYRPGALVQLRTMCQRAKVEVYGREGAHDPADVVKRGLAYFADSAPDIVLIDTAGRHKEEQELLDEMKRISRASDPDLALLVIDGTIGRRCFSQAEAFHKTVPVGGIVVTKLDSSAKGGGALAASAATGAQIMYIGTGERVDDLEKFSPTRFVGRLLGMGDIQAVLDLVRRLETEGDESELRRLSRGKMNMEDFYHQIEEITKTGSVRSFLENLPGVSGTVKESEIDKAEGRLQRWRYIIQSMTVAEKADPNLIKASRTKRIARGSGWPERDVRELVKSYKGSKNMIKATRGRDAERRLRQMGLG
jgi:signal recognition particle subunit SRP54